MGVENLNYREIGSFSVNGRKEQTILSVIFLLIAGIGSGLLSLSKVYDHSTIPVFVIILSVIGFIVVHELVHLIFISIFSKGKIKVRIKIPTIAVGSEAYFDKIQYVIIALAPVIVLGLINLLCLLMLDDKFIYAILLILNFATASGDYILVYNALKQSENSYFVDTAEETKVYMQGY